MPTVDMSQVKDGFDLLPDGDYEAVFTAFKTGKSKKGFDKIDMTYTIDDGENDGRKLFRTRSLQPQALFGLKQDAIALGADPEDWSGEVDTDEALEALIGARCTLVVGRREYTDDDGETKTVNDIKKVLAQ